MGLWEAKSIIVVCELKLAPDSDRKWFQRFIDNDIVSLCILFAPEFFWIRHSEV